MLIEIKRFELIYIIMNCKAATSRVDQWQDNGSFIINAS